VQSKSGSRASGNEPDQGLAAADGALARGDAESQEGDTGASTQEG